MTKLKAMTKRTLSVLLCTVILLSLFVAVPFSASAEETTFVYEGVHYLQSATGTWTVSGFDSDTLVEDLVILQAIEGTDVVAISKNAFEGAENLRSVVIPDTVTLFGSYAFKGCSNLESVVLPANIYSLSSYCFYECTSLNSIQIPDSVVRVEANAFAYCDSLESVTLSNSMTDIGTYAFQYCTALTNIEFPDSLKYVYANAFKNCEKLSSVTFNNGLKTIGSSAFKSCIALESVDIPDSVSKIESEAFKFCSSLKSVHLPASASTVSAETFYDCYALESIVIPKNYTSISDGAFSGCLSLNKVTFESGSSLKYIYEYAFELCVSLTSIDIPSSVTRIEAYAFTDCYYLSKVTLHNGLKYLGEFAFVNCAMTEIELPRTIESMGYYSVGFLADEEYVYWIKDFVIYGLPGSVAELYAQTLEIEFGLGAPVLSSVENTTSGIKITFEKMNGVSGKYRIYRKTTGSSWKALGDVTDNTFTDITAVTGTRYTYTVKFIGYDGTTSRYDKTGLSITRLVAPTITKFQNLENGVKISWNKVDGAAKYRVYVYTKYGWEGIGNTTSTSFVHENVTPNTTYKYTVKAFDSSNNYGPHNSTGWNNKFIATPKITSITNSATGAKITWGKVEGAENYRVFVKTASGWKGLGNTTSTSFIYTGALSGQPQTYTVRCMSKDGKTATSGYHAVGTTYTFLATPKVTKIQNTSDGAKLTWDSVNGAEKYRVYVKTSSGWKGIGDTDANSFVHTDAASNTSYTYTVKAFDENGLSSSFISTGFTNKFIATPEITAVSNTANGVKLTWGKVAGAVNYRVYVKTSSGWKGLGNTTSTTYTHTGVTSGTEYTYTVRCMTKDGKTAVSDYNKTGTTYTFLSMAQISSITNTQDGAKLTITAVSGATKYRVYFKSDTGWKAIGDTDTTTFIHADAQSGTNYTYTVKAFKDNKASGTHNSTGWSNTFYATPVITELNSTDNGVEIVWDKVAGVTNYRVFVLTDTGWKGLGNTTNTTYLHKDAVEGIEYTYTVRCVSKDGKKFISDYSKVGWSVLFEK